MSLTYYRDPNLPCFEIKRCDSQAHSSRRHVHDEFSLGLVEAGASMVSAAGKRHRVQSGCTVLIPAGVIHQCQPEDLRQWRFQMLYLKRDWLESVVDLKPYESAISVKRLEPGDYQYAVRCFGQLREERSGLEKETLLIAGLPRLLDFDGYFRIKASPAPADAGAAQRVRDYLEAHFLEAIRLDDLVRESGLSKYHMIRVFQQVYRTSPHAYQTMLRVNYAKRELQKQDPAPVAAIAQNAGFFDQSHLVKTFKLYLGTSPLGYRQGG